MNLIIKPTELCNFACTFCSSSNITNNKTDVLDLTYIARFLDRFPQTSTIIVNGGDPLMLPPDYYWRILELLQERGMEKTTISFTSNLWDFKKHPEKWEDLFRHPQIGVGTSFNYGDSRRITMRRVFTESDFLEIFELFLTRVGYRLDFISVIDDSNKQWALDNVRLAQRLDVVCKLNHALASGRQSQSFLWAEMYRLYIQVYEEGLMPWEHNTQQLINSLNRSHTICPLSRECDQGIRALHPNGEYYSCGAFGDDRRFPIDFEWEMGSTEIARPLSTSAQYQSMHDGCWSCELFSLCNGCRKTISDIQQSGRVEQHCRQMQAQREQLLAMAAAHPYPLRRDP